MKNKSKIIAYIVILLSVLGLSLFGYEITNEQANQIEEVVTEVVENEETEVVLEDNASTTEIPELTEQDEVNIEEQEVESEDFKMQGEIAYESGESFDINGTTGAYSGLTYYSQIDGRWSGKMYSSIGNPNQTIGTSGCGPTSAAMLVSSIKGTVTPDTMSDDFVSHGYRSANNGTYWSAYRYVADKYNISYTESSSIDRAVDLIRNQNYMCAVSVGNGLFTTGGHFIVIYGVEGDNLKIYDPYLYAGKFETSTRRGKVTVSGNTVYCPISNFRAYANYQNFFLYKNEHIDNIVNPTTPTVANYKRYVTAKIGLNVRNSPGGNIIESKAYGSLVTVYETSNNWSRIDTGWVSSNYLSSYMPVVSNSTVTYSSNAGAYYRLKNQAYIYSNSNLTGNRYTYLKQTQIRVIRNVNASVDYVQVVKTGRVGYINKSTYSSNTTSTVVSNDIYKRLRYATIMYSNSNLTGTRYNYLALTQVQVLSTSNGISRVKVVKTGRIAYIKSNMLK